MNGSRFFLFFRQYYLSRFPRKGAESQLSLRDILWAFHSHSQVCIGIRVSDHLRKFYLTSFHELMASQSNGKMPGKQGCFSGFMHQKFWYFPQRFQRREINVDVENHNGDACA
jgi:hypothetical protein